MPQTNPVNFSPKNRNTPVFAVPNLTVDTEYLCVLNADYTLINGTGVQAALNATTNGALTLNPSAVGSWYAFEAQYFLTNTGTTSHTWDTLFGGTVVPTEFGYSALGNSLTAVGAGTGSLAGYCNALTAFAVTPASVSGSENALIQLEGSLFVPANAGGTLIPQIQLSAAPGGVQKMKAGSFFRLWMLSQNEGNVVGPWS
jgi:hypothetical protein